MVTDMHITTKLKSLDERYRIAFDLDMDLYSRVRECISTVENHKVSLEYKKYISDLDCYESAVIEGACTTLAEVQLGVRNKGTAMVIGTIDANAYVHTLHGFNVHNVLDVWEILVRYYCENTSAGTDGFRTGMVYICSDTDGEIAHTPAKPEQICNLITNLLAYTSGDTLLDAIVYHFYIAYVHPFCDGNGRLARILCTSLLSNSPIPLSKSISCRLSAYYRALRTHEVDSTNKLLVITDFVTYVLQRVIVACEIYIAYASDMTCDELRLVSTIDSKGKGFVSVNTAKKIMKSDSDEHAETVLKSLVSKGFLIENEFDYRLKWR